MTHGTALQHKAQNEFVRVIGAVQERRFSLELVGIDVYITAVSGLYEKASVLQ